MSWSIIPPVPDTPACAPPLPVDDGWVVTRHADLVAVLTDPRCSVPVASGGPPGTLAWLRGAVSRFSAPDRHTARRALGVAALAGLDPDELRAAAARLTEETLDQVTGRLGGPARPGAPGAPGGPGALRPGVPDRLGGPGALRPGVPDRLGGPGAPGGLGGPGALSGPGAAGAPRAPGSLGASDGLGGRGAPDSERCGAAANQHAPDRLDVMDRLARRVPLAVLAARLGLAEPAAAGPAVAAVAAAYHPGAEPAAVARADEAVAALLALAPPAPTEIAANRIGLLVQACDATAGLIGAAARHLPAVPAGTSTGDLLAEVLRLDPPVRATRRVTTAPLRLGEREIGPDAPLLLRFDAANRDPAVFDEPDRFRPGRPGGSLTFGAGPRGCPGERHALALAAGVVDVLRRRCRPTDTPVRYVPHPTLRVPTSLEVTIR